jgi:hypothetical protein
VIRALFPFLYLAELLYRWAVRKVVIKCARKECGKGWCERRCERSCRCCQRACCRGLPCHWDAGPLPGHKVIMVSKQLESFGVKRGAVGVVSWEHQDKPSSSEGYVKVHWEYQELQNTMKYTDLKLPKEQGGARLGFDRDGKPAPYPRKQCCKKRCLEPDKGEKWAKKQKRTFWPPPAMSDSPFRPRPLWHLPHWLPISHREFHTVLVLQSSPSVEWPSASAGCTTFCLHT